MVVVTMTTRDHMTMEGVVAIAVVAMVGTVVIQVGTVVTVVVVGAVTEEVGVVEEVTHQEG